MVRSPITRADFPLTISMGSGFFFCGMMLLPVDTRSDGVMKPNSSVAHSTHSSASRDMCTPMMALADNSSITKSRSDTPSTLGGDSGVEESKWVLECKRRVRYV